MVGTSGEFQRLGEAEGSESPFVGVEHGQGQEQRDWGEVYADRKMPEMVSVGVGQDEPPGSVQVLHKDGEGCRVPRFYRGLYDAMHLCYRSIVDEKAPAVEDTEKRLKAAVLHSLEEESEGLRKCEEELKVRRMRFLLYPLPR